MDRLINELSVILANTYTLYLKTQNYHWHIKGPQFKSLHELFESQYQVLAQAVDELAERIIIKGHPAPATFKAFESLKTLKEGDSSFNANEMLSDLVKDHSLLIKQLHEAIAHADAVHDSSSLTLLDERITSHEKMRWMLDASREERLEK